ncbi:TPA: DNA polymerase/3'-5' exonuclease PolX, partial [Candidatus Bipolaricaulota bacterium]|nr:DNA polymerase/3'-5' exonuclease PolX [Candidatus Bipolaricaulota bacterium]
GYHQELKAELPVDLYTLTQVEGVGPKTAKLLYDQLGVRTLEDLERAAKEGLIRNIKGLGPKIEEKILRGLAEAKRAERRELLGYALPLARDLCRRLSATGLFQRIQPAGSLRRGKETVGDLDILAVSDRAGEAARAFVSLPEVEEVLAQGPKKSSVRLSGGLQVDLRIVPEESFGAALQYFTGSKAHNIRLRERAVARGWKLNEYGLFSREGERLAGEREEDIYRALGLVYIPPELREDQGEIQAAEEGALPALVEPRAIKGDLHVHTDWSDGKATIEEMAEEAKRRGLSYIAVTDHFRFSQAIRGLSQEDLLRQVEEIERLNERLRGIRILSGVEANIARDGSIDVPERLLKRVDLVIASVHSHFRIPKKEMTKRLIRAVENEYVDVLGHPSGRLIGERPPYEADWEEVFHRAAKAGTILEVNANPQRLDLSAAHIREAIGVGVRLLIGTDAHAPEHLDFLELGVITCRRGWAEAEDVVNSLPWEGVLAARKRAG